MGKTTDAHIAKITNLSNQCSQPSIRFADALISAKKLHQELASVEKTMTDRHKAIFGAGTSQSTEKEQAIASDSTFVQASKKFDALNDQFAELCLGRLDPARQAL